jgi:hypothetical protein
VGSLRGRKFYGVFDGASGEYRVCVQLREEVNQPRWAWKRARFRAAVICRCVFKGSRRPSTN